MKKFVLSSIVIVMILMSSTIFAQNSGSNHLFHFGLKASPDISWFAPSTKGFTDAGAKFGFSYGLITEFGFTKNYAFSTGLEVLNAGGKMTLPDSTIFPKLNTDVSPTRTDSFLLHNRTYRLRYVNIPLLLKLKTNQIASMTYFGQFGFDVSFKWRALADDDVTLKGTESTLNDVIISKDINFIRLALNVGLGAEYNLSGATSLAFSINYNNGFTNALIKNSKMLLDKHKNTLVQNAVFNYVSLTVGVLF